MVLIFCVMFPSPFENIHAVCGVTSKKLILNVHKVRLRLIFSRSSHPACLFSKGFVFPLPIVSEKNSGTVFLFNKQLSLADCCILFTITIKKTKCSTALSAPIFSPLLFCSGGVFPLKRSKNRRCFIRAAKRISASIAVRGTTFPISVCFSHTAVTRSVRKREYHFIFYQLF